MARRAEPQLSKSDRVVEFVEDRILETHRLVSESDIAREFGPGARAEATRAVDAGGLSILFSGPGLPKLYAPRYMFDEALRAQKKPAWLAEFQLPERQKLETTLLSTRDRLTTLDRWERVLYATGDSLEDAVGSGLDFLGFSSVIVTKRPDHADIEFQNGAKLYLLEAKGKGKHADKDDVLQLRNWIDDKVAEGADPESVEGVLFVNHFRHIHPKERAAAVSQDADRLCRRNHLGIWTGPGLFHAIQRVASATDPNNEKATQRAVLLSAKYLEAA
jgi:hypothetical protein